MAYPRFCRSWLVQSYCESAPNAWSVSNPTPNRASDRPMAGMSVTTGEVVMRRHTLAFRLSARLTPSVIAVVIDAQVPVLRR